MRFYEELAHVLPRYDRYTPGDTWLVTDYPTAKPYMISIAETRGNTSRAMACHPEHITYDRWLDSQIKPLIVTEDYACVIRFREERPLICVIWARVENRVGLALWEVGFPRKITQAQKIGFRQALWDVGIRVMRTYVEHVGQMEHMETLGFKDTGRTVQLRTGSSKFGWVNVPIMELDLLHRPE